MNSIGIDSTLSVANKKSANTGVKVFPVEYTQKLTACISSERPYVMNTTFQNKTPNKPPYKVVHLCAHDYGGAGKAAFRLHKGLQAIGQNSSMLVANKKSTDPDVRLIAGPLKPLDQNDSPPLYQSEKMAGQNTPMGKAAFRVPRPPERS